MITKEKKLVRTNAGMVERDTLVSDDISNRNREMQLDGIDDGLREKSRALRLREKELEARNEDIKNGKTVLITKKVCRSCNKKKDFVEFHKRVESVDGHENKCKDCTNKTNRRNLKKLKKSEKVEMTLEDFIKHQTEEGKMLTLGNIAIVEAVDNNVDDALPTYKGMPLTLDAYQKAKDWLTKNGWGNPSQRKAADEKIKRSESELVERLRYLVKKVVRKEVVADKILVLLGEAGL
jgi:hypothetical protein